MMVMSFLVIPLLYTTRKELLRLLYTKIAIFSIPKSSIVACPIFCTSEVAI
jgi:hypothetical protein